MKQKYILIILIFSILFNTSAWTQKVDSTDFQKRIESLEANQTLFDKKVDLAIEKVKAEFTTLALIALLVGSPIILGIGFWGVQSWFNKKKDAFIGEMDAKIDSALAVKLKEKDELIKKMITEADIEARLLNTKKIKVIGEEDISVLKTVLRNIGFNMRNLVDEKKFDVLLIYNNKGEFFKGTGERDDLIESKIEKSKSLIDAITTLDPEVCVLYYCSKQIHFPSDIPYFEPYLHRINFATNPAQIYGNLLNTLKYQDKIS